MLNTGSKTKKMKQAFIDNQSAIRIGFNDDLLTEILIWLPVTSLLRFKSVSKHWRLLLTHKHFTHRFDNNNLSKSLALFASTYKIIFSTSQARLAGDIYVPFDIENKSTTSFGSRRLDDYFNRSNVRIMQSCNGLLFCFAVHNRATEYYVFNPTTKQLALIPSVPKNILSVALPFHQTNCVSYKVVCIRALEPDRDLFQIQVYLSDTRTWKICVESFSEQISKFDYPVYYNGAVHWAPDYHSGSNFLYLKLDAEQLRMLPLPEEMMSYERNVMYFGESGDHLYLIFHTDGEEYLLRVNVYEMLPDHTGWLVKYRVQLNGLLLDFTCLVSPYATLGDFGEMEYPYQNDFEVVDVVRGKEEEAEDTFLVLSSNGKMISYNVYGKNFKELYRCNNYNLHLSSFHRYIETLSPF